MRWGVDCSKPLSHSEAAELAGGSFTFVAGYLGGNTPKVWTTDDFRTPAAHDLDVLPIWVAPLADEPGRQWGVDDGNAALQAMIDRGMSGVLVLDIENGLVPEEYGRGFTDAVHAGKCSVVLYGNNRTLWGMDGLVDFHWLAWWGQPKPVNMPFPADLWQYASGERFDYNVANLQFPFAEVQL